MKRERGRKKAGEGERKRATETVDSKQKMFCNKKQSFYWTKSGRSLPVSFHLLQLLPFGSVWFSSDTPQVCECKGKNKNDHLFGSPGPGLENTDLDWI